MKSFDATFDRYRALLEEVKTDRLRLANEELGSRQTYAAPSGYNLADNAYASLLDKLADRHLPTSCRSCAPTSWATMPI
jgi:hypothetical protein